MTHGTLQELAPFVASGDALRLARHAERCGGRFELFSDDPVIQFLVEEALFLRLDLDAQRRAREAADREAIAAAQAAVKADLAKLEKKGS